MKVVFCELRVERDRDCAAPNASEPRGGKLRSIAHEKQYTIARSDAESGERARYAPHLCCELGIAQRRIAAGERDAPCVALERRAVEFRDQGTVMDDADPGRQPVDLSQDVAGHEDRHAL